jgi:hypothetical protein
MSAEEDAIGQDLAVYYRDRAFTLEDKARNVLSIIKRTGVKLTEFEKRHVDALEKALNNR